MKNVLIMGGSYFAGRVFTILSSREAAFDMTVVNRGSRPLGDLEHVTQVVCDRHDTVKLASLLDPSVRFDAVIDFCAYEDGDIRSVMQVVGERAGQYIYISTSSVYDQSITRAKTELDRVKVSIGGTYVDEYIAKKAGLESECIETCSFYKIHYTILRPAFLYGPYNYAPRESYFIEKIVKGEPVPTASDASARFSVCYVKDLARALQLCVANPAAYGQVFNVSSYEEIDYEVLMDTLSQVSDVPFTKEYHTVEEILADNIPLPFPLDNNDLCDGSKIANTLGLTYTPFREGMEKAFRAFSRVYRK